MPLTPQQILQAEAIQHAAAHDLNPRVRLVAGPGTGKSYVIEERVSWLLNAGAQPDHIFVVSFTRASARELRDRIRRYCVERGVAGAQQISVTTVHSLALRILRMAGLLGAYPADPMVMDQWELDNIFDWEFSSTTGLTRGRSEHVRRDHEAFWSTGQWGPPNYIPPNPPITPVERTTFAQFHGPRTQTYSCVLPGEIVRQCVRSIQGGVLNPVAQLNMEHLVVDEFQDLNPIDLLFVGALINGGVRTFVAGDDDQSIYSFRFASPTGIQSFTTAQGATHHILADCFRCTPAIVTAATALINAHPLPGRIPKGLASLYAAATPPLPGLVCRWRFGRGQVEARAIAESCRDLINAGIPAREILILISNKRVLGTPLAAALDAVETPYDALRTAGYLDRHDGRFALACLRIACDLDDYVSHRTLLGALPRVGIISCRRVGDLVISNNLNFRDLFYLPLPGGVFATRETNALGAARQVTGALAGWQAADTLHQRGAAIEQLLDTTFGNEARQAWLDATFHLPQGMTLQELRDYLMTDNHEQQDEILAGVYQRLGEAPPPEGLLPSGVRIMTMHGAKGLSAQVVFIPGLEEEIFPGPFRQPYPGLVLEAARLLYVSISRARVACVLSFADRRSMHGSVARHTPSRFTNSSGGAFQYRATGGLTQQEVATLTSQAASL